jgi:hypothetical protein
MYLWLKHTYLRNVLIETLKPEICVNRAHYMGEWICLGLQVEQDRQCTINVTLRRVRATIVAVEKQ